MKYIEETALEFSIKNNLSDPETNDMIMECVKMLKNSVIESVLSGETTIDKTHKLILADRKPRLLIEFRIASGRGELDINIKSISESEYNSQMAEYWKGDAE